MGYEIRDRNHELRFEIEPKKVEKEVLCIGTTPKLARN